MTNFKYRNFKVQSSKMTKRSEIEKPNGLQCMTKNILGEEQLSKWSCRPEILLK